ncbi:MAG: hypothetical protein K0R58_253 [Ramlibacter sp.]|nr:hypothetical protein [Ramlibacter sp.]
MQATFSTRRIAAALLLSPVAAAMVASPAFAQQGRDGQRVVTRAEVQSPVIERFTVRALSIDPGREMRFRVLGSPGARADIDIPKVVQNVPLREVQPGVYEGSYTIRLRDDLSEIDRAVATLRNGPMTTTARIKLEGEGAQWPDRNGPRVVDVTPNHDQRVGERGRTEVSARFRDDRSGVDVSSVRLRIDGENVTERSRVTANQVHYEANLRQGRHQAELVVRDRAGNVTRTAWNFVVNNDIRGNNGVSLGYGR